MRIQVGRKKLLLVDAYVKMITYQIILKVLLLAPRGDY